MRLALTRQFALPTWLRRPEAAENAYSLWLVLGFACLALCWLTPVGFAPWPGVGREAIAAFAFVLLAGAAIEQTRRVAWPRLAFLAFAVACIPLVQFAVGQLRFRSDAFICALYLAAFGLSVSIGATLARSARAGQVLGALLSCLIVVAMASAGMALSQWLGPSSLDVVIAYLPPGGRPYANMGQPNHLATQLILGIVAVMYLFEHRRIGAVAASLAIAWMGSGVALSQSRTAWISIATLVAWWLVMRKRSQLRTTPAAIGLGCATFVAAVHFFPELEALWNGSSELASVGVRTATGTRPGHWLTFWEAILRSPWVGYGWNQVPRAQFEAAVDFPAIHEWALHSHNLILDLLIYNGIPIGLTICIALLVWFHKRIAECRTARQWCLLALLFPLFVHALLEYPLHFIYFLLPAGLLMGFLGALAQRTEPAIQAPRITLTLATLALGSLATAIAVEYFAAEEAMRILAISAKNVGPPPSQLPRADWYFVDGLAALHRASAVEVKVGMEAKDIEILRAAALRYPYPHVLERLAQAASLIGDTDTTTRTLRHSCKVYTITVCDAMRLNWNKFQSEHAQLHVPTFPDTGK